MIFQPGRVFDGDIQTTGTGDFEELSNVRVTLGVLSNSPTSVTLGVARGNVTLGTFKFIFER